MIRNYYNGSAELEDIGRLDLNLNRIGLVNNTLLETGVVLGPYRRPVVRIPLGAGVLPSTVTERRLALIFQELDGETVGHMPGDVAMHEPCPRVV
jgi:hypothetical protein